MASLVTNEKAEISMGLLWEQGQTGLTREGATSFLCGGGNGV